MRVIFLFLLLLVTTVYAADENFEQQQILLRIQPIGKVRVDGESSSPIAKAPPAEKKILAPGQATYEQYCITCHRDGVANAPKFRHKEDWSPRLAKQKLDELTATAIKGLNAMPPKGTCNDCTDEDIKQAVQYMLPQS